MAIQRINLTKIKTELLRICGYGSSATADWTSDANLYNVINRYGQSIPSRMMETAQRPNRLVCDMWRTVVNSSNVGTDVPIVAAGSSTIYFPVNLDYLVGIYDLTNKRIVPIISDVSRYWIDELRTQMVGPPQKIELRGYETYATDSTWRRVGTIWPSTETGITPSFEVTYYRLPSIMAGVTPDDEYPDADPKFHSLWIYGPALELLSPSNPTYDRFVQLEKAMLLELAQASVVV